MYVHVITWNNGKTPTSGKWHSDKQTKNNKKKTQKTEKQISKIFKETWYKS